jgi:transposase-like protein
MIIYLTQVTLTGMMFRHGSNPQSLRGFGGAAALTARFISRFTLLISFRSGTRSSGLPVRFGGLGMTLLDLQALFDTDEKCREILTRFRWPNGVECPRCKAKESAYIQSRKLFECAGCGYQFSVLVGTIFNDSHLPLEKWFVATYLICESRKGMSANQIKRMLGISYKTAWYLCHRIRAAMIEASKPKLGGTVEMDETYVGGRKRGTSVKGGPGPHASKEIVIGIRQRGGDLRFFHARDVKHGTLAKYIRENISQDVDVIVTDEFTSYPWAMDDAKVAKPKHKTIRHRDRVYVDGDIHTNTVESAFSLLKRGIMGTWHQISAKHLAAYLNEMTFRFNRRKSADLFFDTLRHMITAPVLTFEKLTA